jgi:hypothetical protein
MKTQNLLRSLCLLVVLAIFLSFEVTSVSAQPPAPLPISPANGSMIVMPTFFWQASSEAEYYEVEVGPQSNPVTIYWSDTTYNLTLTPNSANPFTNEPLYWRVRAYDSSHIAGPWSSKINFTKYIPSPALTSPANGDTIVEPVLEWQAVEGAAYYKVELSTSPTFYTLDHTYTTYNTQITPNAAIADNNPWYWRVSGVDAADHVGTPSAAWTFIKNIPAPTLVSPANGITIVEPVLEWQAVEGAAYYKVELSTSPTFVPVNHTYTTYNTRVTPAAAIADNNPWYWRVSGVDAADHVGTPSPARTFIKNIPAPTLVSPANGATINEPVLEWQAVDGAAYYQVELSTSSTFVPVNYTYTTYNIRITPVDTVVLNTYYWRVSGVDAEDNVGTPGAARTFTLNAPPAATDPTPLLLTPGDGATITTDPTFQWTRVLGAHDYHLIVSEEPDFSPSYDYGYTHNASFTPYTYGSSGYRNAYPNGTYYWKIEARNGSGGVIATSLARSFTKQMTLPLIAPADGATITTDPTFQWTRVVGAHDYHLIVSEEPDFSPSYDYGYTDYVSFTPYTYGVSGYRNAYPNGTYYWKIEARDHGGTVIVASLARSFTKQMTLLLIAPADVATLTTDPTYQWTRVVGAHDYHLIVSNDPDFSPSYDYGYTDYVSFTPYTYGVSGYRNAYTNGTYYWKVEARDHGGTVIVTSVARSFTKGMSLPLIAPAYGARLTTDPTFQWSRIVGAHDYRLLVSKESDFSPLYDYIYTDYVSFTPYAVGQQTAYADGIYYWKVEGRDHGGTVIVTSDSWTFTIGSGNYFYLPLCTK